MKPWMPVITGLYLCCCQNPNPKMKPPKFDEDIGFLKKHTEVVVLSDKDRRMQVAVCPAYQGRVMTSTTGNGSSLSYGWINRGAVASGKRQPHINVFGGEDRFWLGPEGGQYSIYFQKGNPFDLDHWQVPSAIDWDPFEVVSRETDRISFRKKLRLENYTGTAFDLEVHREIVLLKREAVEDGLGVPIPSGTQWVGFESINSMTNKGNRAWKKESGLLSIWILGMFNPSPNATIVVPFKTGPESELGAVVNDAYFGKIPSDRLVIREGVLFFKADGLYRSKIGISRKRVLSACGSYDSKNRVLTLVQISVPEHASDYVNSMWEIQKHPYAGDVVNSYNDGPPQPGAKPLGPFYELESSSPAAELKPAGSITHVHRTLHFQGEEKDLNRIAKKVLGADLDVIKKVFPG